MLRLQLSLSLSSCWQVRWRILGPNADSILQTTDDISTPSGFLQGSVTYGPGQRGSRTFDLQVKSFVGPEVEEVFIVEIYQLVSTGEIDNGRKQARLTVSSLFSYLFYLLSSFFIYQGGFISNFNTVLRRVRRPLTNSTKHRLSTFLALGRWYHVVNSYFFPFTCGPYKNLHENFIKCVLSYGFKYCPFSSESKEL